MALRQVILVREIDPRAITMDGETTSLSGLDKNLMYDVRIDRDKGEPVIYERLKITRLKNLLNSQEARGVFVYVCKSEKIK